MTAIASRKNAEAPVPMMLPIDFKSCKAALQRESRRRDHRDRKRDRQRMAEREEQADRDRPLALLHQFAHHIVDRCDVVGVDRMTQPEHISEKRGAKQRRPAGKRDDRPGPDQGIRRQRKT